jgi:hypothetical protein
MNPFADMSIMKTLKLLEALRDIREALYNVPEVGEVYDQQHSDTHMRAALLITDLIRQAEDLL